MRKTEGKNRVSALTLPTTSNEESGKENEIEAREPV